MCINAHKWNILLFVVMDGRIVPILGNEDIVKMNGELSVVQSVLKDTSNKPRTLNGLKESNTHQQIKRLLPDRKAKEGIENRIQKGLYKPKAQPHDETDQRLRLLTDKKRSDFVVEIMSDTPEKRQRISKTLLEHRREFHRDRLLGVEDTVPGTPTQAGKPTRQLPATPGGTVNKAVLVAEFSGHRLFQYVANPSAKGSVFKVIAELPVKTMPFKFTVTPQVLAEAKEIPRSSQTQKMGTSATALFTTILELGNEYFEVKDCVRSEEGVLRIQPSQQDEVKLSKRDHKQGSDELMMHHCHIQGHRIGGACDQENLLVGTPGSNFSLFAYLEAHIQQGKFFKDGNETLVISGEIELFELEGNEQQWRLPLHAHYRAQWGTGRTLEFMINPTDMQYPTYSAAHLMGAFIEIEQTPTKKRRPEDGLGMGARCQGENRSFKA